MKQEPTLPPWFFNGRLLVYAQIEQCKLEHARQRNPERMEWVDRFVAETRR